MTNHEEDLSLVEFWSKADGTRKKAGALAGMFAAVVALGVAMLFSKLSGGEVWFPIKWGALPFLGNSATEFGFQVKALVTGMIFFELLGALLGVLYAQFTGNTFKLTALIGVGFFWGTSSWIFLFGLYMQSFRDIFHMQVSYGAAFPICMIFGLSFCSLAFFDRALRGN